MVFGPSPAPVYSQLLSWWQRWDNHATLKGIMQGLLFILKCNDLCLPRGLDLLHGKKLYCASSKTAGLMVQA
jgi:hypothetical protein